MNSPERSARAQRPGRSAALRPAAPFPAASLLAALLLAAAPLATVLACASGNGDRALPEDEAARVAEIAELEARVERDRARLAGMVTTPRDLEAAPFHEDPDLRAVAERLTADAARLERLRGDADDSGNEL